MMSQTDGKNTYLESRALWQDIYGNLQTKVENCYRVIFCLSVAIAIAMIGLVIVACETKIKPIPFVLHGNDVITMNEENSQSFNTIKPKLSVILISDFIRHVRAISSDNAVNANNHIAALSVVSGSASNTLNSFFDSQAKSANQNVTRDIEIKNVLRESNHHFEVRWIEETRNEQSGEVISTQSYIAEIDCAFNSPSTNPIILKHNPFGFVISNFSLAQDQ